VTSEVIIIGSLTAKPGKEDALRTVLAELVIPTHAEDGCILYAVHQGAEDPTRFAIVERWTSQEVLDAHIASEHMKAALAGAGELLVESPAAVHYTALPFGDTVKGSLSGHAA
jgi:quinol monooxygenase YgiN